MNDIPIVVIDFLKRNAQGEHSINSLKVLLMNELNISGKEAKKYAKWWVKEN